MARVGIGLYGLYPAEHLRGFVPLEPGAFVEDPRRDGKNRPGGNGRQLRAGYRTPRTTRLATIPVGYADGFSRRLSGKVQVLIGGKRHPVVGRICMDEAIVDVGDEPVQPGDEVVLIGRQGDERIDADEWAQALDTIGYEIVCDVSARVPRVYVGHDGSLAFFGRVPLECKKLV